MTYHEKQYVTPYHEKRLLLIANITCQELNIDVCSVFIRSRRRQSSNTRFLIWTIARATLGDNITFDALGNYFAGHDHSTVIHGINKIKKKAKKNEHFAINVYDAIMEKCNEQIKILDNENN